MAMKLKVLLPLIGLLILALFCIGKYKTLSTTSLWTRLNDMNASTKDMLPNISTNKSIINSSQSHVNWDERFRFVPNNVKTCNELFGGNATTLPQIFTEKLDQYKFDYENITSHVQGIKYMEGYTARIPAAYRAYLEIASHKSVKTICETGFNGGHSTFGWLEINPTAHVYSFDLDFHAYSRPMANHIRKLHPDGRFHITWGDSMKTLPEFHQKYPNITCDVMIIDGGHTTNICRSDFVNFREMASVDNVVIMDNYPQKGWNFMKKLGDCWEWAKRNAQVAEIFNCYVPGKNNSDFGFSVGRIITVG